MFILAGINPFWFFSLVVHLDLSQASTIFPAPHPNPHNDLLVLHHLFLFHLAPFHNHLFPLAVRALRGVVVALIGRFRSAQSQIQVLLALTRKQGYTNVRLRLLDIVTQVRKRIGLSLQLSQCVRVHMRDSGRESPGQSECVVVIYEQVD